MKENKQLNNIKIKRAILSVSDKTGIVELAKFLEIEKVEIFSTGGTFKLLKENNITVLEIDELTGFPEMMDGRVKTLNPKVHGGILALRDNEKHIEEAKQNGIKFIDLVVVNLYPFEKTVANPDVSLEDAIENIDIGGPTMIRSSAKNYKFVTILTDPSNYDSFIENYIQNGGTDLVFREQMALNVFRMTSTYDNAISVYLENKLNNNDKLTVFMQEGKTLRYGENSHQSAKIYLDSSIDEKDIQKTLAGAILLNGKEMSYNNYMDAQSAVEMVAEFEEPAAIVIKHNNPCGVATGNNLREAIERAWYGDPISAFGSVLAFNREFDMNTLKFLKGKETKHYTFAVENDKLIAEEKKIGGKMIEAIIAPSFSEDALAYLTKMKNSRNVRVLSVDLDLFRADKKDNIKRINGGFLVQTIDDELVAKTDCVTKKTFSDKMLDLAEFSMKCCKIIKSNTITLGRLLDDGSFQLIGMGAGQPNRVDSLRKLAVTKARENLEYEFISNNMTGDFEEYFTNIMNNKVVMASDAFFPFDDTVRTADSYGIKYIIQPGGSMKDQDSIDACNELDMAMIFSGNRHFRH